MVHTHDIVWVKYYQFGFFCLIHGKREVQLRNLDTVLTHIINEAVTGNVSFIDILRTSNAHKSYDAIFCGISSLNLKCHSPHQLYH